MGDSEFETQASVCSQRPPSRTASSDVIMRTPSNSRLEYGMPRHEELRVATWNVAAVNNNPFEYWVTHPDPAYNVLMDGVQDFIDNAGERDVAVGEVFTDAMARQLFEDLRGHRVTHVDDVAALWETDYRHRAIISGFIKDTSLGKKRLASMPDRITNTIHTAQGKDLLRPTVINYYQGNVSTTAQWWAEWRKFVFRTTVELFDGHGPSSVIALIEPINAVKYPALSAEEERVSVPLQAMCLAIFDAILVHILNAVSKDWQAIRASLASAFRVNKDRQVRQIMPEPTCACGVRRGSIAPCTLKGCAFELRMLSCDGVGREKRLTAREGGLGLAWVSCLPWRGAVATTSLAGGIHHQGHISRMRRRLHPGGQGWRFCARQEWRRAGGVVRRAAALDS